MWDKNGRFFRGLGGFGVGVEAESCLLDKWAGFGGFAGVWAVWAGRGGWRLNRF